MVTGSLHKLLHLKIFSEVILQRFYYPWVCSKGVMRVGVEGRRDGRPYLFIYSMLSDTFLNPLYNIYSLKAILCVSNIVECVQREVNKGG